MPAGDQPATFQLRTHADGPTRTVLLSGELDMLVAPYLEAAVRRVCSDRAAQLVLDLRSLTFMDSAGLHCILTAQKLCREFGCSFAVIPGPRQVQALFELTGLVECLPFQPDGEPSTPIEDGLLPRLSGLPDLAE